jgi:sugar lactone lactonase YvrE
MPWQASSAGPAGSTAPRRDTLFVATARTDLDDDALARQPHAGKVFAIDGPGARGLPACPTAAGNTVV